MKRGSQSRSRTLITQYIIPGTGDPSAKIPEEMYSTRDPQSLEKFIKQCDVLIASLPGTKNTAGLIDAEKLGACNCIKHNQTPGLGMTGNA
jgi:hypothetical protein